MEKGYQASLPSLPMKLFQKCSPRRTIQFVVSAGLYAALEALEKGGVVSGCLDVLGGIIDYFNSRNLEGDSKCFLVV